MSDTATASVSTVVMVCPRCNGRLHAEVSELTCGGCGTAYPRDAHGVWDLTSGTRARSGYDPLYFPHIADVEESHFWFVTRRECILDALRASVPDLQERRIVDVGCGVGGLVAHLARSGVRVAGACDSYVEGLRIARARVEAPLFLVDEGLFPPLAPGQDLIGLFDVLEHIDDDRSTLRSIAQVLRPGGVLVLTVPAHPFLFDEADRLAHHRRRYRGRELRARLEEAGLTVERLSHVMALLVPGMMLARAVGRLVAPLVGSAAERRQTELRVTPIVNGLLRAALRLERWWLRRWRLPFGTSLLAVARRPACDPAR